MKFMRSVWKEFFQVRVYITKGKISKIYKLRFQFRKPEKEEQTSKQKKKEIESRTEIN